jgi:hypothetical protein
MPGVMRLQECLEMRLNVLIMLRFMLVVALSHAAEIGAHGLILTYSVNNRICHEAAELLKTDRACRPFDTRRCSDEESYSVSIRGKRIPVFEEVATNQYGYTQVFRTIAGSMKGYTIVYLNQFQGDRHPRLVQTWKVDAKALDEVLRLPPGPIPYARWKNVQLRYPQHTNATEFAAVLNHGEQLSNEWFPVIEISGNPYLVERECSGSWAYGGYYACNRVIKLTIKKLAYDKKTTPYCQFVRPRKKMIKQRSPNKGLEPTP